MQEYQDFTNGSTYSGSPSYISDDDGKFGFGGAGPCHRPGGGGAGHGNGVGPGGPVHNAAAGELKDFPLNLPVPGSRNQRPQACRFCQNNGEEEAFYRTHCTKDVYGRAACPILRKYVCPLCTATGDLAHTIKYCPTNQDGRYNTQTSLTDLKKRRNASGKPGNLRGAGLAEASNGLGMSSSVGRGGLVGGMSSSAGHWLNDGFGNFSNGGARLDQVMGFQNGVLLKDEMMRRQLQQKTIELEQLKTQLSYHLNNKGCGDPSEIMRMAAQAGARHFAQRRVEVLTPMEGHLRNARTDVLLGGGRRGGEMGGDRRGGKRDQVTDLGDELAQLREGSVPHQEGNPLQPSQEI